MKKLTVFLTLILAALIFFLSPVGSQYVTKIYHDNNGDRMVVDDGGVINILAGGALQYAGTDILNTITPGVSAESGVVVLSSTKSIDSVTVADRLEIPSTSTLYLDDTSVTSSGDELNYIDGSLPGWSVASKAMVLSSTRSIGYVTVAEDLTVPTGGTFYLDGTSVTASGAELNYLDIGTLGVVSVTKAIIPSATGTIFDATIGTLTIPNTGGVVLPSGASFTLTGTSVTSSGVELNYLDGSYPGLTVASTAQVLSSTKSQGEVITGTLTIPSGGLASFAAGTLGIQDSRIFYATSVVFSTTTENTICLPMPSIDADDWVFPSLTIGYSTSYTYLIGATPQAGAVQIMLSSAPHIGGVTVSLMALED